MAATVVIVIFFLSVGEPEAEIVNAITGRTDLDHISRISKCKLFYRFLRLLGKIPTITNIHATNEPLMYNKCKEKATGFQVSFPGKLSPPKKKKKGFYCSGITFVKFCILFPFHPPPRRQKWHC